MKAKDLANELLKYPDFEVSFSFGERDNSSWGYTVRQFDNISIGDIGHSDKVILLDGTESD
jgi:hypothetical protein